MAVTAADELIGGGYGHGRGLSQNGARGMAEKGKTFLEILKYYYGEIELHDALDTGDVYKRQE